MNEPKAAALLEAAQKAAAAGQDDSFALHEVLRLYFVTESGKAAALRLIDEKLERGEFSGAAWLGDELLNLHPNLLAERPAVLFRTALAYHLAGNAKAGRRAGGHACGQVPQRDRRRPRQGRRPGPGPGAGDGPVAGGGRRRRRPTPGPCPAATRSATWSPPPTAAPARAWPTSPWPSPITRTCRRSRRQMLMQQFKAAGESGMTLGVLPVADRGELFFQDGMRVYAVSLESGVPLPGWVAHLRRRSPGPVRPAQRLGLHALATSRRSPSPTAGCWPSWASPTRSA